MAYTTIKKPSDYFNTVTYVANQTDNRQITVGFQPDFTWLRDRDQAVSHQLYDGVRGALKALASNNANAESTETDTLKSFNSTGFTLGTGWGNQTTGDDYVAWNWLGANGTASNTDGSITSTVSANTTSGFSIVSYTGTGVGNTATIGHSLGVAPSMIIVKSRDSTGRGWIVYHKSLGATKKLDLNDTTAATTSSANWNDTEPTSSVFSVGTGGDTNTTDNFIAYCFADVKGFSKFGSYVGNGNADGTFVYTGFSPAFVMVKRSDGGTESWFVLDNKRDDGMNPRNSYLMANLSSAEDANNSTVDTDFLSNGFKLRATTDALNTSGATYIYMAFAEEPLVGDNPCTAR